MKFSDMLKILPMIVDLIIRWLGFGLERQKIACSGQVTSGPSSRILSPCSVPDWGMKPTIWPQVVVPARQAP
jgi:hypothetical protein